MKTVNPFDAFAFELFKIGLRLHFVLRRHEDFGSGEVKLGFFNKVGIPAPGFTLEQDDMKSAVSDILKPARGRCQNKLKDIFFLPFVEEIEKFQSQAGRFVVLQYYVRRPFVATDKNFLRLGVSYNGTSNETK